MKETRAAHLRRTLAETNSQLLAQLTGAAALKYEDLQKVGPYEAARAATSRLVDAAESDPRTRVLAWRRCGASQHGP